MLLLKRVWLLGLALLVAEPSERWAQVLVVSGGVLHPTPSAWGRCGTSLLVTTARAGVMTGEEDVGWPEDDGDDEYYNDFGPDYGDCGL